jgi:hypothetical protein
VNLAFVHAFLLGRCAREGALKHAAAPMKAESAQARLDPKRVKASALQERL